MITRITLVRHGTTLGMEQGLMQGRSDAPLSERGLQEVRQAALSQQGRQFDAF